MPNVIESFGLFSENEAFRITNVATAISELRSAHEFVRLAAQRTLSNMFDVPVDRSWGATVKRRRVDLPVEGRPRLIEPESRSHNFSELVNLCATVERLLDAMDWADNGELSQGEIECCHPTTGSNKIDYDPADSPQDDPGDNDLVIVKGGKRFRFEVSDISGRLDTNRKIPKDLNSLGIGSNRYQGDTLFLVVPSLTLEEDEDEGHWLKRLLRSNPRLYSLDAPIRNGSSFILKVTNRAFNFV
jgi:hypothetical protein